MADTPIKQEESSYEVQQQEPDSFQTSQNSTPHEPLRTVGGFIVDDDDDGDDAGMPRPSGRVNGFHGDVEAPSSNAPQNSASFSPSAQTAKLHSDDAEQATTQDQDHASIVPNGIADDVPYAPLLSVGDSQSLGAVESSKDVPAVQVSSAASPTENLKPVPRARLPQDKIGMLEDRIKEDPRGDVEAWLSLINEYKRRNKAQDVRATYKRFLEIFPTAAEHWIAYANFELEINPPEKLYLAESVFQDSLANVPNLALWTTYLNYVRRRNKLTNDPNGTIRQIVSQSFDFVMDKVGVDKDSGPLWQEYIQFIRSGPGQVGGSSWQDQQKMDELRKAFHRAVSVPTQSTMSLWRDYDAFEMSLNKTTGRKFMQERSTAYVSARTAYVALQNITANLSRNTTPILPPAFGFEGEIEYMKQVEIWRRWIEWEKSDPLTIKDDDVQAYRYRVVYVYTQAVMTMRFWPEFWSEAADFCFSNDMKDEGQDFLLRGAKANPESCLIAFKRADYIESTTSNENGEEGSKRRGDRVRKPYDDLLDTLYELSVKLKNRENVAITRIKQRFEQEEETANRLREDNESNEDDEDDDADTEKEARELQKKTQIEALQKGIAAQLKLVNRTITYAWIALMRSMRRIQGKGAPGALISGSRGVFQDARKRGKLTSEMYVSSALMEYYCYQDLAVSSKIFERGIKLYPDDETIALEYIKHLLHINDITNARAVFESTVNKLAQKPETLEKAQPVYAFFHEYESHYGELSQIKNLEKRMVDLFPNDTKSLLFARRTSRPTFDPTAVRLIISPATQARTGPLPTFIEAPGSIQNSPKPSISALAPTGNSPKRRLDDADSDAGPARKQARAESPLKGAAGRRLDAQKRTGLRNEVPPAAYAPAPAATLTAAPPPQPVTPSLPPLIWSLLNMIPRAELWGQSTVRFNPQKMTELIRNIDTSRSNISTQAQAPQTSTPMQLPPTSVPLTGQIPQMQAQYTAYPQLGGSPIYGYPR